ncbi:hypothetical protein ACVWYN_003352 [Pedobacter sp. UYP24]
MDWDFTQQKILEKKWFKFTPTGLRLKNRKLLETHEYELKYEDIGSITVEISGGKRSWLATGIFLTLLSFIIFLDKSIGSNVEDGAEFFYLLISVSCIAAFLITFKKTLVLTKPGNVNPIEFLKRKSDQGALNDFIVKVAAKRKDYLLEKYGVLNEKLTYEAQFNNLKWLLENYALDRSEYDIKLIELEELYKPTSVLERFSFCIN